jgi:RimJ/RimL family protein N-acetyltransferase
MSNKLNIKHLESEDFLIFRKIRLEALQTEPASFASRFEDWVSLPDAEWQRWLSTNPTFVAIQNDEPIAIMGLIRQGPSKAEHRANLVMVYVTPALRGTGVAAALLKAVTVYAQSIGIRQLELAARAENAAAIQFYIRQSFQHMGRVPNGTFDHGKMVDEVLMVKLLGA